MRWWELWHVGAAGIRYPRVGGFWRHAWCDSAHLCSWAWPLCSKILGEVSRTDFEARTMRPQRRVGNGKKFSHAQSARAGQSCGGRPEPGGVDAEASHVQLPLPVSVQSSSVVCVVWSSRRSCLVLSEVHARRLNAKEIITPKKE